MAQIIQNKTPCAICGNVLKQDDDIIGTSGGPMPPEDPLWQYQDAGMHRACFRDWSLRDDFRERFNTYWERHCRGMRYMTEDGTVEDRDPRP